MCVGSSSRCSRPCGFQRRVAGEEEEGIGATRCVARSRYTSAGRQMRADCAWVEGGDGRCCLDEGIFDHGMDLHVDGRVVPASAGNARAARSFASAPLARGSDLLAGYLLFTVTDGGATSKAIVASISWRFVAASVARRAACPGIRGCSRCSQVRYDHRIARRGLRSGGARPETVSLVLILTHACMQANAKHTY